MSNNKTAMLVLVLCSFVLCGCSTKGNKALKDETQDTVTSKFKEGVTTKQELIDALGVPSETTFTDGGLEVLKYEFTRFVPKLRNFIPYNFLFLGSDGKKKELVVLLDENHVVKKLVMNESEVEKRSGVAE